MVTITANHVAAQHRVHWTLALVAKALEVTAIILVFVNVVCVVARASASNANRYGIIQDHKKELLAHRVSYELHKGEIPSGLVIDHLCRNRKCVNPSHLDVVTNAENVLRGESLFAKKKRQTHCIRGHLLEGSNLRIRENGTRFCRACDRDRARIRKTANGTRTHVVR